ncbi:hypothetical protein CLV30_102170 [Haloactinopolyspora alba]|uniref:Uncharacterized protein n=1 Tax=Haloactinopolyspora alba TaxID=648780 RepID=A0A2P8EBE5_9ACTN|nr:hypothetical protein [Haloactinopolyspora alba]PSL06782.1 hypothetical protein CLV30_102170 [Haloactinopolyspora alba]
MSDLEAHDGTVHALVYDGQKRELVTIDPDGAVSRMQVQGAGTPRELAVGPDGSVHVADGEAVYRVEGSELVPEIVVEGADVAGSADATAIPESMSIAAVAVDGDGQLVWTATFVGSGPDEGSQPVMSQVFRLVDGQVEHVAGADSTDLDGDELDEVLASPPADMKAADVPLDGYGTEGELAIGEDGAVYVAGPSSVLRVEPGGGVEAVLSEGERAVPDEPYGDAGDASGFGGSWVGSDVAAEGGTVAVVDSAVALEQETVDVGAFSWGDELEGSVQQLADRIVRGLGADESVESADDTAPYGQVAVLVHDGQAATAMAHVTSVALDGDRLYVTGETAEDGPASEVLVVSTPVPEDWR